MSESPFSRPTRIAALAGVLGFILLMLAGFGGGSALWLGGLAHPLLALAISWSGGTRRMPNGMKALAREFGALLLLWGSGLGGGALLLGWPTQALSNSGSLSAALGLSAAAGVLLLLLWRIWPFWQSMERDNSALRAMWRRLPRQDASAARGLGAAIVIAVCLAGILVLVKPGLVSEALRWRLAAAGAVWAPVLHWALQKIKPPLEATAALDFLVAMPEPDTAIILDGADMEGLIGAGDLDLQLYAAARNGRVEQALQLIEAGADMQARPAADSRDQRSLMVLASILPDLRLLRTILAHGADLNDPSQGMTPLLAATRDSWHGRPEAVMTLLTNGANPRLADAEGNTPLHHASRSTDPSVAALLLDAEADIDALNYDGQSALAIACSVGNWRLAKFLLERGATAEPAGGRPALLAAASTEDDDPAGVQLLLRHKARIGAVNRDQHTALHEAARAGHPEITSVLLAAGANPNARDNSASTPWLLAARKGQIKVLERLRSHRADTEAVDSTGRNALIQACMGDAATPELVQYLLDQGVSADTPDLMGKRAVDLAASAGRWTVVTMLDPEYALPAVVTDIPAAPAQASDTRPPLELLREGLETGRYEGLESLAKLCAPGELGRLLHEPDYSSKPRVIEWLLRHGADAGVRDSGKNTPMFLLLSRGADALPALCTLLNHAVSPAGMGGLARFMAACMQHGQDSSELERFALELLERGADPFATSAAGESPLSLAVGLTWLNLQNRLLEIGVNREAANGQGMTPLHLATVLGREASLKSLILHGASPDARTTDGQTSLGVALALGRRDLADWLNWSRWQLPRRRLRASDVPGAAKLGDTGAVRRLLDLGFPVDSTDTQGCTALLRAAGGGHLEIVRLLLERGADPQRPASSGATPLSAAVSKRQPEIVTALLGAGADPEYRLPGGVTVLMLAAALGLPDIIARLVAAGADVEVGDARGLMPLHCATLYGFGSNDKPRLMALLDTLLLAGADPDASSTAGVSPLLLLLGSGAEPGAQCDEAVVLAGVERLLEESISLERQDARGFGPLHLAALHGFSNVIRRLLRAGADPALRDTLNRTPREIAIMRGFVDVASEFDASSPYRGGQRYLREPGE
ncbi:MAG: ankyrin repeat domain-containing protein [Xanthomonadaceae bacterium]|jgi:ankyrin repeat protein|nr:ankyrin repeat domain-containing protein [Xanthomonadaceae bacterium]